MEIPSKDKLWQFIVDEGRKKEPESKGIANKLNSDDINTICETMDFFNATAIWIGQTAYDLSIPKYRIFDWLAMCVMSRNDDNRQQNEQALKVLVYAWLQADGEPEQFIANLREHDYEIEREWENVVIPE